MKHQEYIPPPHLRRFVKSFLYFECDDEADFPFSGLVVPDGYPEIYLIEGEVVYRDKEGEDHRLSEPFFAGQLEKSIRYLPSGPFRFWSVKLQPWSAGMFMGIPQKELLDQNVELGCFLPASQVLRLRQIWRQPSRRAALLFLVNFFSENTTGLETGQLHVERAVHAIRMERGRIRVGEHCRAQAISRQYLEREFRRHLGLTPQGFARVLRIRQVVNYMRAGHLTNFTELAHHFQYADQAHFIRDFKKVTGLSPGQFFRKRHFVLTD